MSIKRTNLKDWLGWIRSLHENEVDLSLERVHEVGNRLKVVSPLKPVITVGGTNGKGSTVAGLEAIYRAAGYRVGAFTSPYLLKHNELVRLEGQPVSDALFINAYEAIEEARGDIRLTPFEFNALAAFFIFTNASLDVWILEVGLGGRLDAVNCIDAEVAVITSIALDHMELLGTTREAIGFEKAGILRFGKPVVSGERNPPHSLINAAQEKNAPLYGLGEAFEFTVEKEHWSWRRPSTALFNLPKPSLMLQNMAVSLMVIDLMQSTLPVARKAIDEGLRSVSLPGRIEVHQGEVTEILDVSHNPHAAFLLKERLSELACKGTTRAVFSMLNDKDILETLSVMKDSIEEWFVAPLAVERGASLEKLKMAFARAEIENVTYYSSIEKAYQASLMASVEGDRRVVFGSFYVVAAVKKRLFPLEKHSGVTGCK